MKIKNIEALRNHMLDTIEGLASGKIDLAEASITAKSSETIMSSLKLQLMYANMRQEMTKIKFLEDCHDGTPVKLIEKK